MTDQLETRLIALGAALDVPPAPDVVPAVLERLPDRRRARIRLRLPARRSLALALTGVLVLAGAAFAIAPTRHAILSVLGLRGVRIERVPRLPPLPPGAQRTPGLGQRIPLDRARGAASFTALLPSHASAAYLDRGVAGGRISLVSGRLLITEFRGTSIPIVFKLLGPGTHVARPRLRPGPALYIYGAPHEVLYEGSGGVIRSQDVRLAGNVLIWQRGPLTVLIEGTTTLAQALASARSLH